MITRLDISDPTDTTVDWWSETFGLKRWVSSLVFKPGLNVLFAPNGFGKSTILRVIGNLAHCVQGGPPVFTKSSMEPWSRGRGKGVRLTHDGALCFYADPSERPGLIGGMAGFDDDFMSDGIVSARAQVSSGQWCSWTINRILGLARETKERTDRTGYGMERLRETPAFKAWQETQVIEPWQREQVIEGTAGQATVLLDEFDRSLDVPMAAHTWSVFAHHVAPIHQLVVAAHSPLVLQLADAGLCNLIDLCPGYAKACRDSLGLFTAGLDKTRETVEHPQPFNGWKPPPRLPSQRPRPR